MATISVPLSSELEARLDALIADGAGSNRADVMRRALEQFAEDEAVRKVLESEQEVKEGKIIRGDIDALLA
ncbi:MAG: ribbon-helix-helix protein, CopG family [Patescibacteria group bacterium UBA2103]